MPASVRDVLLLIRTKEDAQRALAGISREMRRTQAIADAASARARAQELRQKAAQMRAVGATRAQIDAVLASARAYDQQAKSIEQAHRKTQLVRMAMIHAGEAATAMGMAAMGAGAAVLVGLGNAVSVAAEYDRQMRLTFTQIDRKFKPSLIEVGEIGRRVAKEIAIPFEQIQPALFEVFSSTEANMKEAEFLLKAFAKAAVAGQTDVQTASRATIGVMNTFGVPIKNVNRILDIQFQLVQEGVGTYEEWATRIGLVSPSAVRAGQSIETMAAALATATRMGMSAARAGTSVARAFDAISNPKTISNLEKMGVKMRDAKGNMLPMLDILKQWKAALEKLPKEDRLASILETLKGAGSTIEARRFLQNMLMTKDGLALFEDVLGEFEGDVGAFDRAYGDMSNSVSAKSTELRNQWMLLKEAIGRALIPAFLDLIGWLKRVLDEFNKLPDGTKKNIANFLLLAGILGIVGGAFAMLLGTIGIFAIALAGITSGMWLAIGVIALVVAGIAALGTAFVIAYQKSEPFRDYVNSIKELFQEAWNIMVGFAQDVKAQFDQHLKPALEDLWRTIENDVLPKLRDFADYVKEEVLPKIEEAGRIIKDYFGEAFKAVGMAIRDLLIPAIKDLMKYIEDHKAQLQPFIWLLTQVFKWLLVIVGVILSGVLGAFALMIAGIAGVIKMYQLFMMILAATGATLLWFWEQIKRFWNWLKSLDWRGAWRGLSSAAEGAIRTTVAAFTALPGRLGSLARQAAGAFINGLMSAVPGARNVGSMIISGLVGSLSGGTGRVYGIGAAVGRAALAGAKAAVAARSPSRKFFELGQWTIQGYVNGVLAQRRSLVDTMAMVSREALSAFNTNSHAEMALLGSTARVAGGVTQGAAFASASGSDRGKMFDVNVFTNEIDPRKTAADLAWELEGRLR